MANLQKVTVELPSDLLQQAQEETGDGVTATVKAGLRVLAARRAQKELLKWRGRYIFSLDLNELRKDRDEF